jgi:hypothetical protein
MAKLSIDATDREVRPQLLQQHRRIDRTAADAAVLGGHRQRREPERGHLGQQLPMRRAAARIELAQIAGLELPCGERAHRPPQHLLLVGEAELHRRSTSRVALASSTGS